MSHTFFMQRTRWFSWISVLFTAALESKSYSYYALGPYQFINALLPHLQPSRGTYSRQHLLKGRYV
jgi:hypothetical protein